MLDEVLGGIGLEWLGHSGFRITAGKATIYVDPYRLNAAAAASPADLILITHGHYDHFSLQDVERVSSERTWLIAPAAVAERAGGQVLAIAPGEAIEPDFVRGLDLRAVAAYNTSKHDEDGNLFHPRAAGCVGYELNLQGRRVYHAGDTDVIPEMDDVAGADV
ncbi:MAG: MBL fold metallo-hydrolase, partial [Thermoleophilaceae bacterium]